MTVRKTKENLTEENKIKTYSVTRKVKYLVTKYERFSVQAETPEQAIEDIEYGVSGAIEYSEEDSCELTDASEYSAKEV